MGSFYRYIVYSFISLVVFSFGVSVKAQEQGAHISKQVVDVLGDGTLVLGDDLKIVLSGIRWWSLFGGDNSQVASPQSLLAKYTSKGPVKVYLEPVPKDRYGRLKAIVVSGDGINIQQDLLKNGLALFWPDSSQNNALRLAEEHAREAGLGRWGWQDSVVKCHNWDGFWQEGLALVKGKVISAKTFKNIIYLNFGKEWWRDFTLKVDKKWAEKNSWYADGFVGRNVEVRGWLYWDGGPQITLEHEAQIAPLGEEGGNSEAFVCPIKGAS